MDSFRKAHSSTTLKSSFPKGTNTAGASMRMKLKKLLYDFSKNDLDSIRKETFKEFSDETLNDSSLDCVPDMDDSSNIEYAFGQNEKGVQENTSPRTGSQDEDIRVKSKGISHLLSSIDTNKYGRESQSSQSFQLKNPEIHSSADEPPAHLTTTENDYRVLSDRSEELDTSNDGSIVSSEESTDIKNQTLFDRKGGLASAIKKNIAFSVDRPSGYHTPENDNKVLSDQSEELDSSNDESILSSEESTDIENQTLFDVSGGLASAIKENIAFSQELNDKKNVSHHTSPSPSELLMNDTFSINNQMNPEFMDIVDDSSNSNQSESINDKVDDEIYTSMVCDHIENTNNIEQILSNYVCRIGHIEQNTNQYIAANGTNMFKVQKNISNNFKVFIPNLAVPFESQNSEEQRNKAMTVENNIDDTVEESCSANLDDTVAESCCTNMDDTVDTQNLSTPDQFKQQYDSLQKSDAETDTKTNGSEKSHNDVQTHITKSGCVVIIKYPSSMYIDGKVIVRSLCGHVEIFGYKLNENPVRVFSPRYNYSMRLKTFPDDGDTYGLFGKLTNLGVSVAKTEDIVTSLSIHDAVIFMEPLKETLCPFVETHWSLAIKTSDKAYSKQNPDLFSKTKSYYDEEFFEASQTLVDCSLYANNPTKQLQENPLWDSVILLGQEKNSVALIAGGKSVGKSTLLRYYVNKILHQGPVVVVDLDPGQSEFTIAGNISINIVKAPLLGPNFTHLQAPDLMLNLGLINVMDNFEKYTRAVFQIANHLKSNVDYHNMPWVINTMGFTAEMGLKLIAYTILLFKPSVVAQLEAASDKHNFHINLSPSNIAHVLNGFDNDELFNFVDLEHMKKDEHNLNYEFIQIENDIKKQYKFSPAKQQRYLNVLGYFSQVLQSSNNFKLNGAKPFFVSKANIKFGFNVPVHEDMIFHVLNAKIVALCHDNEEEHELGKAFLMGDCAYICYGHGIVRGADIERGVLYLITPVDLSVLQHVNALLYAEHMPELQLARSELQGGAHVPYREPVASPRHARLMAAPRRRFNPMRLLRPKHPPRPPPQ